MIWLLALAAAACGDTPADSRSGHELQSFAFRSANNPGLDASVTATINGTAITATVPFGIARTALVATFSTTGTRVTVGGAPQTSGATANDFTDPVIYRVDAADGSTKDYTVTVTAATSAANELTALSFRPAVNPGLTSDVTATIKGATITATVPFGTPVTALVATFATTGASVTVGGTAQTSDVTPNDFTGPVTYRVVAADRSTQDYVVTVTVASRSAHELTALSFRSATNPGLAADVTATINGTTITATVPFGSTVGALVATFSTTGASVTVGDVAQISGTTINDFTTPVIYRVVAADSSTQDYTVTVTPPTQQAYVKASNAESEDFFGISNTAAGDFFGYSVALSSDGATLAVGAGSEDSAATGVGGDQASNAADGAGAVYVFTRNGTTWNQQAYVKASNPGAGDFFGYSVALSGNGATLAVGASNESSAARGIGGNQASNAASLAGAVYVFTRSGTTWGQQAYVKASNTDATDLFGASVALSDDGSTLAVGAGGESSAATGIDGDQADNSAPGAGAVYVFTRSGATWRQQAYVKPANIDQADFFGGHLALSGDGSALAVTSIREDSAGTGSGGDPADNTAPDAGAVYVFARSGSAWSQQAYVKASNASAFDEFGGNVALSADRSTLAVGALIESSAATGIGGNQADNSAFAAGAVYVFR